MRIVSFGDYTFPDAPLQFSTNFADLVPRSDRLPGLDGGYDDFGDDSAPQEVGRVTYGFYVRTASRQALASALDDVREMARFGRKRLYMSTEGSADGSRWTYAKINNIQTPINSNADGHKSLRAVVDWQANDPRWFDDDTGLAFYNDGFLYDDDHVYDAGAVPKAVSGLASAVTLTRGGNAPVYPYIVIKPSTGGTITNPSIERYVDGFLVDSLFVPGTATTGQFVIDCQTLRVRANGLDIYATFLAMTPWWMKLEPGANSLNVQLGGTAQAGTVYFCFHDAWY